jgi:hypothetical protein
MRLGDLIGALSVIEGRATADILHDMLASTQTNRTTQGSNSANADREQR